VSQELRSDRLTLDVYLNDGGVLATMADEVRSGLTATPKTLPSKYFYDARGSDLFEQITELPEYYQTRTELGILQSIADPLVAEFRFGSLLELGSGSATKTRTLLDAMERHGLLREYVPFDVSESMLRESSEQLLTQYPTLRVHGVVGDFHEHLPKVPPADERRLTIFLGSTIGNLDRQERQRFLGHVRGLLKDGDAFLLGVDLVKDVAVIEAAYNDAAGVTAEFNRNILSAVNAALSANFVPEAYRHHAFFNKEEERIEMHLIPNAPQQVTIPAAALRVEILPSESIRTEISCKFTRATATAMLEAAGFRVERWYTDPRDLFALVLASPSS
jgi:L-histidine Nalpha-methyltransferase